MILSPLSDWKFVLAKAYADHKEKYHNNKLRALKCQACNYSHKSIPPIRLHMFDFHEPVEIPYVIQTDTQVRLEI